MLKKPHTSINLTHAHKSFIARLLRNILYCFQINKKICSLRYENKILKKPKQKYSKSHTEKNLYAKLQSRNKMSVHIVRIKICGATDNQNF